MCGIAGLVGSAASEERAALMIRPIAHRGPDAGTVWADPAAGIALGHRRLAILDLSPAGAQPMSSHCGRYVTAFNGEIYNHLELRQRLEQEGAAAAWRGHSDTETILAAASHWGLAALPQQLVGMFAIAIWDRHERALHLIRDRFGEKPVYYGWVGRTFAFASELKAIVALADAPLDLSRQAVADFVRLSYVPAPASIYRTVFKLQPGCHLVVDAAAGPPQPLVEAPAAPYEGAGLSIGRYWSITALARAGERDPLSDHGSALSALEERLEQAVTGQTLSDVPLGAFLSGGVDSSLVVALLQRASRGRAKTFTIGFDDPAYDESPHGRAVAAHLGTDHQELIVSATELRTAIPLLPRIYDEPFADASGVATYLVAKLAREHVTVALSGDGADELFGGYTRHLTARALLDRLAGTPAPMRHAGALLLRKLPRATWRALERLPLGRRVSLLSVKVDKLAALLALNPTADALYDSLIATWRGRSPVLGAAPQTHGLRDELAVVEHRMMLQDGLDYLPDDVLVKVDRAAMSVSLETRAPYLDHRVAELAWRMPIEWKIAGRRGKLPLREILYRHVPRHLIERPKIGFGLPIGQWLRGPLREWAGDLLHADPLRQDGLLDAAIVRRTWQEHVSGRADHTTALWNVLMFQQWREAQTRV